MPVTDPAWLEGLHYLLSTQDKQGVWRVYANQRPSLEITMATAKTRILCNPIRVSIPGTVTGNLVPCGCEKR